MVVEEVPFTPMIFGAGLTAGVTAIARLGIKKMTQKQNNRFRSQEKNTALRVSIKLYQRNSIVIIDLAQ
jgi:hypothetical protein